jgi:hypothetical protein
MSKCTCILVIMKLADINIYAYYIQFIYMHTLTQSINDSNAFHPPGFTPLKVIYYKNDNYISLIVTAITQISIRL